MPPDHPWRRRWATIGGVVLAAFVVFAPSQADRIGDLRDSMGIQSEILADLHSMSEQIRCEPVGVPNHRPVPHIALWAGHPARRDRLRAARADQGGRLPRARVGARAAQFHARPERPEAPDRRRPAGWLRARAQKRVLAALLHLPRSTTARPDDRAAAATWARRRRSPARAGPVGRSRRPGAAATCSLTRCTWVSIAIGSPSAPSKWVGIPVAMMKCGWKQTSTNRGASRAASAYSGSSVGRCSSTRQQTAMSYGPSSPVAVTSPCAQRPVDAARLGAGEHLRRQVDAVDRVHSRAKPLPGPPGPAAEVHHLPAPLDVDRRRAGPGPSRP